MTHRELFDDVEDRSTVLPARSENQAGSSGPARGDVAARDAEPAQRDNSARADDFARADDLPEAADSAQADDPAQEESATPSEADDDIQLPEFLEHPEKTDLFLLGMLFVICGFGVVMSPLRAWRTGHPWADTLLVGGYTSSIIGGANASVGDGPWWGYWLCTLVGVLKFMPFYYWMGRRWGMDFIDLSVQYTPRIKTLVRRAMGSSRARAFTTALVPLGYCPGPVPNSIINALLGLLRVPFWAMMAINVASVLVVNGIFVGLGWTFGTQVLSIVQVVNRYLLWITLVLIAIAVFQAWRNAKKTPKSEA